MYAAEMVVICYVMWEGNTTCHIGDPRVSMAEHPHRVRYREAGQLGPLMHLIQHISQAPVGLANAGGTLPK